MMLLLSAWRQTHVRTSVQERCSETFRACGTSIIIMSLTDLLVFCIGSTSAFTSIRYFCAFSGDLFYSVSFLKHYLGACVLWVWMYKYMSSMKLVIPLHFISWKKTPDDSVTPQRQSQFTPKMKANAVPRLLSSLVWIDQYNECNGMTSFMEFMQTSYMCNSTVIYL